MAAFGLGRRPWWHHVALERLRVRPLVPARRTADGAVVLLPDRFRGRWTGWLQRWLPQERRAEELRLDARGGTVWSALEAVPGISVRELVPVYAAAHPEDPEQAVTRILQFLAGLAREGCVGFEDGGALP